MKTPTAKTFKALGASKPKAEYLAGSMKSRRTTSDGYMPSKSKGPLKQREAKGMM